jgi:hypothetical protein
MPGPGPRAIGAARRNEACESCHPESSRAWRRSAHATAFTDPVFQKALAEEPSSFCRDCHAPETDARETGVSCVTCHDPNGTGEILAARASARAPHGLRVERAFATERACAGCHEFTFPGRADAMQRTLSEHRASPAAATPCASCHGAHDVTVGPAMLESALVATALRSEDKLVLRLAPGRVGHGVPTGDLFRRLVVSAEVVTDDHLVVTGADRILARRFRFEGHAQTEIADERISSARDVELELGPASRGRPIAWRVEWQRVSAMHGDEAEVAERVIIMEGREP